MRSLLAILIDQAFALWGSPYFKECLRPQTIKVFAPYTIYHAAQGMTLASIISV